MCFLADFVEDNAADMMFLWAVDGSSPDEIMQMGRVWVRVKEWMDLESRVLSISCRLGPKVWFVRLKESGMLGELWW